MGFLGKIKKSAGSAATVGLGALYVRYYKKNKVDARQIFYCSHYGSGMLCSPYAIFKTLQGCIVYRDQSDYFQKTDG